MKELQRNYAIDNKNATVIGTGAFGTVYKTYRRKDKNSLVAIKVLDKYKLRDQIGQIVNEVSVLNQIDHPNIVKYFETYDDKKWLYLVMEYVNGKTLLQEIADSDIDEFTEKKAAGYMEKIFYAVNHCHAQNIIHRDIKPDNVMISKNGQIKLIDFGLATQVNKGKSIDEICGTPHYMAPELFTGLGYGSQADMWSLGVILYQLVSGWLPFNGKEQSEIIQKITKNELDFSYDEFENVSKDCKDLIKQLLIRNPKKRLTCQ